MQDRWVEFMLTVWNYEKYEITVRHRLDDWKQRFLLAGSNSARNVTGLIIFLSRFRDPDICNCISVWFRTVSIIFVSACITDIHRYLLFWIDLKSNRFWGIVENIYRGCRFTYIVVGNVPTAELVTIVLPTFKRCFWQNWELRTFYHLSTIKFEDNCAQLFFNFLKDKTTIVVGILHNKIFFLNFNFVKM